MRAKRRWMNWILEEAETNNVAMPWDRRSKPSDWKSKRSAQTDNANSVPA